jgi:gliding motility-associated lipoprotein GldD
MNRLIIILFLPALFFACSETYTPKPRGYFRIDLPEKKYQDFEHEFPYSFQFPEYSDFIPDRRSTAEPFWANVEFPEFKATVHLSYKEVNSRQELNSYIEDARSFVNRHIPKATAIHDHMVYFPNNDVYGMLFEIQGRQAASPFQFYLTDSLNHFIRGALYFNVAPNNDSLAPVINFIQQDIKHMIATFKWE